MLELVDVPVNGRKTGYVATAMVKGRFVVQSGVWTAAQVAALGTNAGKPGYAKAGDPRLVLAYTNSGGRAFPVTKIYTEPEGAEDDNDSIAVGQSATYFTAGTFRTTEFTSVGSPVFGNFLKVSNSGTLTAEATATVETGNSVARVEGLFNSSNIPPHKHRLEFTIIAGEA